APQFGHSECAGGASRMFADLRERVAERLVLRLGTANGWLLADLEVERPQGRPPGVGLDAAAVARRDVAVGAAARAQPGAVGSAQRRGRQLQEQRVAHEGFEVDHVDVEQIGLARERVRLEQLVDMDRDLARDRGQAAAAGRVPAGAYLAAYDDA